MDKRFLILFICGLFMSLSATAQNSVTAQRSNWMRHAEKTIIKYHIWGGTATVTCSNVEDGVTFIYSLSTMQTIEVTLENIYVNDMVIENDTVYFCGMNKSTRLGMMGCFRIPSFFTPSGLADIDDHLYVGETDVEVGELTRIAYYNDPLGTRHVYCVGEIKTEKKPCLVDWVVNHGLYWAGYVDDEKESFTDVKVVRRYPDGYTSYLATVGFDSNDGKYLNIRIYDMNFIFSPSGPQDWRHVYKMAPDYVRPWQDSVALLAMIDNSTFVTVSYREGPCLVPRDSTLQLVTNSNIHIGIYDLNQIIAHTVYGLVDNYEIPMGVIYNRKMNQFIYNKRKDALVFLHNYTKFPSSDRSEYCEVPFASLSTSGTLQAYINPSAKQYGLDTYTPNSRYILSGHDVSDDRVLRFQMNTLGVLSECAEPLGYRYSKTEDVASHNYLKGFIYGKRSFSHGERERAIEMLPLYIECEK